MVYYLYTPTADVVLQRNKMDKPLCRCGQRPALVFCVSEFVCGECFIKFDSKVKEQQKKLLDEVINDTQSSI
jgi:hypothetical protein